MTQISGRALGVAGRGLSGNRVGSIALAFVDVDSEHAAEQSRQSVWPET